MDLTINYLKSGWAELSLLIGEDEKTLYFENVPNDPIYEILESAIKSACNVDSTITLYNLSKRISLTIKKIENYLCRIEYDNSHWDLPVKTYCKSVLRMFDTYIFNFSIDDFTKNWGYFPEKDLERLRTIYHEL